MLRATEIAEPDANRAKASSSANDGNPKNEILSAAIAIIRYKYPVSFAYPDK